MMKKLLHIVASPRQEDSRTLKVAGAFLDGLRNKYPGCLIEEINVAQKPLPELSLKMISGKYMLLSGKELNPELKDAWGKIEPYILQFLAADGCLITTPMWNFSIPYFLKHYIDLIIQPKYLFRYTATGIQGLAKDKKMAIITSRGGDYSPETAFNSYDYQEPYLRAIFGLAGITGISFIHAQPMDMEVETQDKKLAEAIGLAKKLAASF